MSIKRLIYPLCFLFTVATPVLASGDQPDEKPRGWLLEAESDEARFVLIQRYLRGFDQPMWEVGERYGAMHEALTRSNFELAQYHWDKIRTTIESGYLKRPKRQANADAILLNSTWGEVNDALRSGQQEQAWAGFEKARNACLACHAAESVPYMNDQPLFDLRSPSEFAR